MTSSPEAMGGGFGVIFEKNAVRWDLKLDEASWDPNLGESSWVYEMRVVGSDGTVSLVKIVSLSPRVENLKVKKVIKVSYLNYRESSVFRVFQDSYASERSTYRYISHIRIMDMLHYYRSKDTQLACRKYIYTCIHWNIPT